MQVVFLLINTLPVTQSLAGVALLATLPVVTVLISDSELSVGVDVFMRLSSETENSPESTD